MGASHITDTVRHPERSCPVGIPTTVENCPRNSSQGKLGCLQASPQTLGSSIQWNTDTVGQRDQQRFVNAIEEIGNKRVEPTYVAPQSDFSKYGNKEMDKTEELAQGNHQHPQDRAHF